MSAASDVPAQIWGVSALINYIRRSFDNDPKLRQVAVRGEITDFAPGPKGVRFKLKEPSGAQIACWAWPNNASAFPDLANGLDVVVLGRVGIYPYSGAIQIDVATVYLHGTGKLAALYEKVKKKLRAEGLFDLDRKRPIPRFPFSVALVSSASADGANDFIKRMRQDVPFVEVHVEHTPVQGAFAATSIAQALARVSTGDFDVVVLARGGGSEEDRLPFNEEAVARAIVACRHPVVTAIGHRADHHVADDVADYAAPTPTDAAKDLAAAFTAVRPVLANTPVRLRLAMRRIVDDRLRRVARDAGELSRERWQQAQNARTQRIIIARSALSMGLAGTVRRKRDRVTQLDRRLEAQNRSAQLATRVERVKHYDASLRRLALRAVADRKAQLAALEREGDRAGRSALERAGQRLRILLAKLDGKNPEAILQQGYAIVRLDGRTVRDSAALSPGSKIEAQLARGSVSARVEEIRDDG